MSKIYSINYDYHHRIRTTELLDLPESRQAFVEEVRSKMPEASVVDDMLMVTKTEAVRDKNKTQEIEYTAEIKFVTSRADRSPPVELRRLLWRKQHLVRNKLAIKALRILLNLSSRTVPADQGLALVPPFTWEVLVSLCVDSVSPNQCCTLICSQAIGRLASGMLLAGGTGLADPCADGPSKWEMQSPPVAGMDELTYEQRISITNDAQRIVVNVISPYLHDGCAFLQHLLNINEN